MEFGVEIGEYYGVVRVPRRVFQRFLPERPNPERCVVPYYPQRTRFETIAERKLRDRGRESRDQRARFVLGAQTRHSRELAFRFGADPGITALCVRALALWHSEHPDHIARIRRVGLDHYSASQEARCAAGR